jgi:hypothetical protein
MNRTHQPMTAGAPGETAYDQESARPPDPARCRTERFVDRDLVLQRCLEPAICRYKRTYLGTFICGCSLQTGRLN